MRYSWVHPEVAEAIRASLRAGRSSWEEVFDATGAVRAGEPPRGVTQASWPQLAEHVARAERVNEVVSQAGIDAASRRFGSSVHAIERAALLAAFDQSAAHEAEPRDITGLLDCAIDEFIAYGVFLSRLVERGASSDPAGTVAAFERFVAAASVVRSEQPSWVERLRVARDGLAALYVRVGRADDAQQVYQARFLEEPDDVTVAIGAARAFLEAGDTARAVGWLEQGAGRAAAVSRQDLAERLSVKARSLRTRLN
jgi:hypothetical protein